MHAVVYGMHAHTIPPHPPTGIKTYFCEIWQEMARAHPESR